MTVTELPYFIAMLECPDNEDFVMEGQARLDFAERIISLWSPDVGTKWHEGFRTQCANCTSIRAVTDSEAENFAQTQIAGRRIVYEN